MAPVNTVNKDFSLTTSYTSTVVAHDQQVLVMTSAFNSANEMFLLGLTAAA